MKNYDVIILGAGASGLMCASHLSKKLSVLILDNNEKIAKKLKISGGGKCNITNKYINVKNFDGDKELVGHVLNQFSRDDMLNFLDRNNIGLELRKKRYFFCERSSDQIIDVLERSIKHCDLKLGQNVIHAKKEDDSFIVKTDKDQFSATKLVVATGGKSFPVLGATDIGLKIAKDFGIKTKEFTPALVGLTVQKDQFWMKELSGLSCYVHIKVDDRVLKEEMLFAHKGISGPAVLSASLYWRKGNISIDFLPQDPISQLIKQGGKKQISSVIPLPKRLAKELLKAIDVKDLACNLVKAEQKEKLEGLHNYSFAPAGNFGFTKAEVSRGGVLACDLFQDSLETIDIKNLHFIGEVVDVTGELGGYNFQWAFGSAKICAKNINNAFLW